MNTDERPKFSRALATMVLDEMWRALDPSPALGRPLALCERLTAVGGYRRGKSEMKDLELLIVPRTGRVPDLEDMLGGTREANVTLECFDELVSRGVLAKRAKCNGTVSSWGEWNRHAVHVATGLPVDLFFATKESWWNRLVCVTGPLESNKRIAEKAHEKGYEWEVSPTACGFVPRGAKWEEAERTRMTMRSERDVFAFVELPFVRPEERR